MADQERQYNQRPKPGFAEQVKTALPGADGGEYFIEWQREGDLFGPRLQAAEASKEQPPGVKN